MRVNYGEIFQQKSKDRKMDGTVKIPSDFTLWPDSWKNVEYKEYERFKKIILPAAESKTINNEILSKRQSVRNFKTKSIDLQSLSNILFYSCGETKKYFDKSESKRAQASAGGRYPIEIYIFNMTDDGELKRKIYHYNVRGHHLEELWDIPEKEKLGLKKYFSGDDFIVNASMSIVMTMVPDRSTRKYGERGYKYAYLEAGAIFGYIQHNAIINNVDTVMWGSTTEIEIEKALDIDGISETGVLSIILNKK